MADNDPKIPNTDAGKRPHATLDLKATEVKAAGAAPGPAPASSYSQAGKSEPNYSGAPKSADAPRARPSPPPTSAPAALKPRGGFLSHLAAGLAGGVLAVAAANFILPEIGVESEASRQADANSALASRVGAVEKKLATPAASELEQKVADLEAAAGAIPELKDAHARLVADTKAALAAAESDAGAPEQLARLSALESKFKALADAGANDPNAGRVEQFAALTGKVADLEAGFAKQLAELRKSVDERVAATTGASGPADMSERLDALKADVNQTAAALQSANEETSSVKAEISALKSSLVKASDVAAAIAPVEQRVSALDETMRSVVQAEADRKTYTERVALSLELQSLKRALDSGRPYANELDAVKRLAAADIDLAALEQFKTTGVPPLADLANEFRPVAHAAIIAETPAAEGGVVDKLIAGAKSVVSIRKVGHAPDDKSTEATVGRIELALKDGRLADAVSESDALPAKARGVAAPFFEKVAARVAIESAVDRLEAQLKSSLGAAQAAPPSQ